jgi:hypothetical protein
MTVSGSNTSVEQRPTHTKIKGLKSASAVRERKSTECCELMQEQKVRIEETESER